MAGTGQFNEVYPLFGTFTFLSSYTPGTAENVTNLGGGPGRVDVLLATNADAVAHVVHIKVIVGGTPNQVGDVNVPAGAGVGSVAPVDVLAAIMPSTQQGIVLPVGYDLAAVMSAAPGAGTYVTLAAFGGTL